MNHENSSSTARVIRLSGQVVNLNLHHQAHAWHPATDLFETSDAYIVKCEIAGVHEDDFCLQSEGNQLTISGQRAINNPEGAFHRLEIPYGDFIVSVELPDHVIRDEIQALYQDGFLTITLPKAKPVQITVKDEMGNH